MYLTSPIQRYIPRIPPTDDEGNPRENEKFESYTADDLNPKLFPCGGAKQSWVHFDAEMGSKSFINWKTVHSDEFGICTIRLGEDATDKDYDILKPLDGTGFKNGSFPCGRSIGDEGKEIKFPKNITCDSCILQMEWYTKLGGKQYMCADIELMSGKIEDCSG